ncbi:hypothetical protein [Tepiditoga spiralis]|nr:hypothetical protein [Tepiditoga spiralis]
MINTYNELQLKYSEQSKKLKAVNKIYIEKLKILENLKDKLSERGVGINGKSIYEVDIHNVAQTSQATSTKSTTPSN